MDNGNNRPPRRRDYSDPSHYSAIPPRASRGRQPQPDRRSQHDEYPAEDEYANQDIYDEEEEFAQPVRPARRSPRPSRTEPRPTRQTRHRARRRTWWPAFLMGCGVSVFALVAVSAVIVILTLRTFQGNNPLPGLGPRPFTRIDAQSVNLSTLSRLQVCDKVGNVTINVNPDTNAHDIKISTKKTVQAGSQSEADQKFKQIIVEIQPPATVQNKLTCPKPALTPMPTDNQGDSSAAQSLLVNVTIPNSNTVLPNTSNSADITITVPQTIPSQNVSTLFLDVEAPLGNVNIDHIGGSLHVRGGTGNVTVTNAILSNGSDIETGQGNVTFNGSFAVPPTQAQFILRCERGNIDVTVQHPNTYNLTLDANSNSGTIKSDFPIKVDNNTGNGPVSYHGPLNPDLSPTASTLVLDVSLGNVTIHKGQI